MSVYTVFAITSGFLFLPFWASKSTTLCPPMGPTNMAAVNSRELQKPLAENNRIRYPVLF